MAEVVCYLITWDSRDEVSSAHISVLDIQCVMYTTLLMHYRVIVNVVF